MCGIICLTPAVGVTVRRGSLQTHQQIVGVVENMSWLDQPDGSRLELFGSGGGKQVAASLSQVTGTTVPLLGQVPMDVRLREGGDAGRPLVLDHPDSAAGAALLGVADKLAVRQRGLAGRSLSLSPVRS